MTTIREALSKINDLACFATEEDPTQAAAALLVIGETARAALGAQPAQEAAIEALRIQVRQADERGDEAMRRAHAAEDALAAQPAQSTVPEHVKSIKIPTNTMEQEFQAQFTLGFNAGRKASRAALAAQPAQEPMGEVVIGEEGMTKGWTVIRWRADLPPIAVGTKLYASPVTQPATQTPKEE